MNKNDAIFLILAQRLMGKPTRDYQRRAFIDMMYKNQFKDAIVLIED